MRYCISLPAVKIPDTLTNIHRKYNYFYNLKKIAVIFLMFVYGTTTVGATVHLHFCMNKFISWNFTETENKTCGKCGMKESATKKGCCKDEVKQLRIDNDHQKSTTASLLNIFEAPVIKNHLSLNEFTRVAFDAKSFKIIYSPPLLPSIQKRTVLYCTYII